VAGRVQRSAGHPNDSHLQPAVVGLIAPAQENRPLGLRRERPIRLYGWKTALTRGSRPVDTAINPQATQTCNPPPLWTDGPKRQAARDWGHSTGLQVCRGNRGSRTAATNPDRATCGPAGLVEG
jgi:hypothetical protein